MVDKILVTPREFAKWLIAEGGKCMNRMAIISICSSKNDVLFTNEVRKRISCKNIITLIFADLTAVNYKSYPNLCNEHPMFNNGMAVKIIKFLNGLRNKNISTLLVHCDAGVSRSAAVGLFAVRYFGMDEKAFRRENRAISPNTLVYDTLAAVSGIRSDYKNWWENINLDADDIFI